MSSFGYVVGEAASLPPSGSCTPPRPWPPPSSFRIRSHREGKFFIGVMKHSSTPNPNLVDLGPGRPEISRQVSKPSTSALPFTSPAPRKMVGEAARRRPETGRMVAHLQVIRSSLSRAPAEYNKDINNKTKKIYDHNNI